MAGATLNLEVATPSGLKLQAEVESVSAPSVHGEFGVLPDHLPLLAALALWPPPRYTVGGKSKVAAVGPGFVEAEPDRVEVLTDSVRRTGGGRRREDQGQSSPRRKRRSGRFPDLHEGPEHSELLRDVEWALAKLEAKEVADRYLIASRSEPLRGGMPRRGLPKVIHRCAGREAREARPVPRRPELDPPEHFRAPVPTS